MDHDHSDFPRQDVPSRKSSPQPPSDIPTTVSHAAASTVQDDKDHLSSLSHNSSPKLTSILIIPSETNADRPRSSEGRVTSLNLPKHSRPPSRGNRGAFTSRRRISGSSGTTPLDSDGQREENVDVVQDNGLLAFGLGDDLTLEPEDPKVLEDVQRALKAKAMREARAKTSDLPPDSQGSSSPAHITQRKEGENSLCTTSAAPLPVTPPKPVISVSTDPFPRSTGSLPKLVFPPYMRSPTRSVESLSSEHSMKLPIPVLLSRRDGSTYLDWSGLPPEPDLHGKGKSLIGRTLSLTKRKQKVRMRGTPGRQSLDSRGSQGDLHLAMLDGIRRIAKRETISRAEIAKDELGRRYAALNIQKPTGRPVLNVLNALKSRTDGEYKAIAWVGWCRQVELGQIQASAWTVTADLVDKYLYTSGLVPRYPAPMNIILSRSHSPTYGLSSPLSSPRSSFSSSPLSQNGISRRDRKHLELNRSLSADPMIEGTSTSQPILPSLSRSLSLTHTSLPPFEQRHSIDIVINSEPNPSYMNLNDSPRTSLDHGSGRPRIMTPIHTETGSVRRNFRTSLSAERGKTVPETSPSNMSSVPNFPGPVQPRGTSLGSGRMHLGVGNMFGRKRRSDNEAPSDNNRPSRSSISDEHDSAREGETTKSDEVVGSREEPKSLTASAFDLRRGFLTSRIVEPTNTSDSDMGNSNGLLTAKIGRRFRRQDKDTDKCRSAEETGPEVKSEVVSAGEQRQVDALGAPGWSSRRGVRRVRRSPPKKMGTEKLQEMLHELEEEEDRSKEIYKARELLLVEANDHNRKIARLLKAVGASIREYEDVQAELAGAVGGKPRPIPPEVLDAISVDPATTLRHGKGWQAVEDSHQRFNKQQDILHSYLTACVTMPKQSGVSSELGSLIHEANDLWRGLQVKSQQIEKQAAMIEPALNRAIQHIKDVQKEYNEVQILTETDYPEQSEIADLEMIILDSRIPRGWLEFAAVWIPEHVLEFIGGFIRFFGVPISEKFIRPFLWYFFRNRYYWKIYSTEPPSSERAWYTRLGYWVIVLSILAWYSTA